MTDQDPRTSAAPNDERASTVGVYDADGGARSTGTPASRVGVYDRPEGNNASSRSSTVMIAISALVLALLILFAYQVMF